MSDDPAAKARALAALFSQKLAPTTASAEHDPSASSHAENASADGAPAAAPAATSSVLGKRTSREEYAVSNDVGGGKRTKIIVPLSKFPDVDFLDLLNQSYIRDLEIETNARITLRGKGVPNDDEADSDEMYVLIQAESESALEKAANRISELVNDPEAKNKQLSTVGQQFVSPLAKDPVAQPTGTFALSSALYANDDGFTMMSSAPRSGPYNSAPAYGAGASAPYQQPSREGEETKDIRVPQDKIGLVIGRGGETIKTIQSSTGVYLQVQKSEPVDGMRIITLKGTPYQIEAGEIEVNRVLTSARESAGGAGGAPGAYGGPGGAPRFGGPGLGYGGGGGGGGEIMQVPQAVIGLVIGARGSTIRGLEERTGAMIKVQKEESSQPGMRDIRLTGAPHAIAAARQAIEELANNSRDNLGGRGPPGAPGMGGGPSGGHGGPSSTTAIPVPTQTTGTIIGRGGEIIKRLQQVSGCRIQLSSDESPAGPDMRDVIVTGRPDQIETAKREIDKIVATKMSGGNVDIRMIGAGGGAAPAYGGGGYNSGYGAPAAGGYGGQGGYGGGYGGPQRGGPSYGHNPYGPPGGSSGYGAPAGYGAAPGGYGAPHQGYGDHSAPAAVPAAAPAAPAEEEAPVPPQDPQEFQTWWGTLSLPQQTAYYRKYYPEMLSQLQQ